MNLSPTIQDAREFALTYHGAQRYGPHPYSYHLDQVADLLCPYGTLAQILGYLHDVQEDAGDQRALVKAGILKQFGPLIASCVELLSDAPGLGRKERKTLAHKKLAGVTGEQEIVLIVKLCDRIANIEFCIKTGEEKLLKMYAGEFAAFRESAYRTGLCDKLWLRVETLLAPETTAGLSP